MAGSVALPSSLRAPDDFAQLIGVHPAPLTKGALDLVILFAPQQQALERALSKAAAALKEDGNLWIAWPKKSSGVATDLTEDQLRRIILPTGLVDNKVCAIDETWSGLRVCKRRENRAK